MSECLLSKVPFLIVPLETEVDMFCMHWEKLIKEKQNTSKRVIPNMIPIYMSLEVKHS